MTQWNWQQVVEDNKDSIKSFEIIPPSKYLVEVEEASSKTSSNGNPMIEARLRIKEGQFASRVLFFRATATDKSQGIFVRNLAAFGLTADWLVQNNPSFDQIANALIGRQAVAQVAVTTWQGQERNEVKNVSPAKQDATTAGAAPAAGAAPQAQAPAASSPFDGGSQQTPPASPFGTPF